MKMKNEKSWSCKEGEIMSEWRWPVSEGANLPPVQPSWESLEKRSTSNSEITKNLSQKKDWRWLENYISYREAAVVSPLEIEAKCGSGIFLWA